MATVWKYRIPWEDEPAIQMPEGAQILDAQPQGIFGDISIWAVVNPNAPMVERRFRLAGTGHPIYQHPFELTHISTMQFQDGALVFHLFECNAPLVMAQRVGAE